MSDSHRLRHWKDLTEIHLPARARREGWPVRLDHCFKRITLDAGFAGVWHQHIARPAERHITGDALERAIRCAEQMLAGGLPALQNYNATSLRYRGKMPRIRETI